MRPGAIFVKTVLKNSLNRCAFSVGFLADFPTLEFVRVMHHCNSHVIFFSGFQVAVSVQFCQCEAYFC